MKNIVARTKATMIVVSSLVVVVVSGVLHFGA